MQPPGDVLPFCDAVQSLMAPLHLPLSRIELPLPNVVSRLLRDPPQAE